MNLLVRRPKYSIQDLQDEMNRMLEDAFGTMGITESQRMQEISWRPAVELSEQNGNYLLKAALPGINKENVDVEVNDDTVTIKGETCCAEKETKENIHKSEFLYGKFVRTVTLPTEVDSSKTTADYKDGILTITLPKSHAEQSKIKKVNIR